MKGMMWLISILGAGVACADVDAKACDAAMIETTVAERGDAALRADAIAEKEAHETIKLERDERRAELRNQRAEAKSALLERARAKEPEMREMLDSLAAGLLRGMLLDVPKQVMRAITQAERAHRAMTRAQRRHRLDALQWEGLQNLLQQIYRKEQVDLIDASPVVDGEVDFDNEDAEDDAIAETADIGA